MATTISYNYDGLDDRTDLSVEEEGTGTAAQAEAAALAKAAGTVGTSPRGTTSTPIEAAIVMANGNGHDAVLVFEKIADKTDTKQVRWNSLTVAAELDGAPGKVNPNNALVSTFATAWLASKGLTGTWQLRGGRFIK